MKTLYGCRTPVTMKTTTRLAKKIRQRPGRAVSPLTSPVFGIPIVKPYTSISIEPITEESKSPDLGAGRFHRKTHLNRNPTKSHGELPLGEGRESESRGHLAYRLRAGPGVL
jgi:hypothetical protein